MLVIAHQHPCFSMFDKSLESSSISEVSSSLPNLPDDHQRLAGFTFAREQHQVSLIRPVLDLFSDRLGLFRGQRSRHDNISPPTVGRSDRRTTSEERTGTTSGGRGRAALSSSRVGLARAPSTRTLSPCRRSNPRRRQVRLSLVPLRTSSPAKLAHEAAFVPFALHEFILISIVFFVSPVLANYIGGVPLFTFATSFSPLPRKVLVPISPKQTQRALRWFFRLGTAFDAGPGKASGDLG